MQVIVGSLLVLSLAFVETAEIPGDFLNVESEAWCQWLDENVHVSWHGIPLADVLASEFGTAAFLIDDTESLKTPVTFDADGLTRRAALWHLTRRYRFKLEWAQKDEPRMFLGLPETQQRERSIGGVRLTTMTHVMRSEYESYQDVKLAGGVLHEEKVDDTIYYSLGVDRDIPFENDSSAWIQVVERYKTSVPSRKAAQHPPNIIIVYCDDLGYGDLSCYNPGAAYKTPRLDQMAREGIRFTDAHSPSTICSPSRYGLYSGQQVCRTGRGSRAFEGPGGPSYIKPGELTIADMVKKQGYRTGVFGKWHVGLTWQDKNGKQLTGGFKNSMLIDYEKSTPLVDGPNERGFDESFITPNCPTTDPLYVYIENGMVPVPASQRHQRDKLPNPGGKWRWDNDEGWMSPDYRFVDADLLFYDKTLEFITDHRKNYPDKPFFVVFSTQISHAPVLPAPEFNGKTDAGPRGDFIHELDVLTGRLLDAIEDLGIDDETLVMFNSDNGPETVHTDWMRQDHDHDAAGGYRGMKRDGWEGGHRVPFIARWPGRIRAGQVSGQLTNTTDIFATVASVVGYELPDDVAVDSYDMLPVMLGTQDEEDSIRPYMLTQSFRGEFQIRQGNWKYLDHMGSGGNNYDKGNLQKYALPEKAPTATGQLYNLAEDPGETTNLFFSESEKRMELQALLKKLTAPVNGRSAPKNRKPVGLGR